MADRFLKMLRDIAGQENVLTGEPMDKHTTFKIGGPADFFVTPKDTSEVCEIVELCRQKGVEYTILGNGSNVLVSDAGYRGVIIQLQKNICNIRVNGSRIYADCGALLSKIAAEALKSSLAGFEFASGIPGTLGGAILMNAGAYGGEMKDVLISADVFKPGEGIVEIKADELSLGYRTSIIKKMNWIVLSAVIELAEGDADEIKAKTQQLKEERCAKQPLDIPSAGSAFKRPEGNFAGKLIMEAGLRGYSIGGAAVSEKHCGFLVNKGGATASDMRRLFKEVTDKVRRQSGVKLEPEVRFIGEFEE